jgi:dinuclear metal center YbgI/SA1388 family protein
MAELKEIMSLIEEIAPLNLAESWDNSGLQIGDPVQEIKKIGVSLDADYEIVKQCSKNNIDLLITHHPLFFSNIKSLDFTKPVPKIIRHVIKNDISIYTAHTNLDSADSGLNDFFLKKLGIDAVTPIIPSESGNETEGLGRIGVLKDKVYAGELAHSIKKIFNLDFIRFVGDADILADKIGVCTGSGAGLIKKASLMGAKVFVTGDMKYHDAKDAADLGICVIDAGHFGTEITVCELLKSRLEKIFHSKGLDIEVEELFSEDVFKIF